ncbi:MAG TPA: DUF1501 domain-containing protein [Pirellulales bacterium]|jgi:hypothetical protein|nr:DUF1501 domain-containing protein [Pirellulales bacterium]
MNHPPVLSHAGRQLLNRRAFLAHSAEGLGGIALASLMAQEGLLLADEAPLSPAIQSDAPLRARPPHFVGKAKRVLMIFCSGACSHLDTWDYKPELIKRHDTPLPGGEQLVTFQGKSGNLVKSPWQFKPRGESGKYLSDLLPNLAELADEMCFIHSMTSNTNTHGPGENHMSTGFAIEGYPSAGAWVSYALGSECDNLPAFVAIPDPRGVPQVGPNNWSSGFLPAVFQGTSFNADHPIANLGTPPQISAAAQRSTSDFLKWLNDKHLDSHPGDSELAARIASYELAAKLQLSAPDVSDLSRETAATHASYGTLDPNQYKAGFARNCLLARRLLERGVRFVQLFNGAYAMGEGVGNWDGHRSLKTQYETHASILDQPAAALLRDLKARGMLDDTLVVWTTEFGRMPTFQVGANGRDHNPKGFTVWLAGAGVRRATTYGQTDEFGYQAVEHKSSVYELHATMLHLLGLNHERLSYLHNGALQRLTFVHGRIIPDVLA